ncbi:hypothetical protein AAOE16_14930 [Ekhidna sp. MALMAid0563]|uniref:hypothetical protein n=1 Tax=Ekhidna sp. MALMAid0563 TaxID=3143937 RepID=UPI0032DE72CD
MRSLFLLIILLTYQAGAQKSVDLKAQANRYLSGIEQSLYVISDSIWSYSEPSFEEYRTAELLKNALQNQEFTIEDSIAGYPTMFIGSFGNKGPIIAILAEADADCRISPVAGIELPNSGFGQGAFHHLLGTGSLGAALALKHLIKKGELEAQIRYYFSTGEGSLGGRVPMVRNGYFDDVDLAYFWHPAPVTSANLSKWDAIIDLEVTYTDSLAMRNAASIITKTQSIKDNNGNDLLLRTSIHSAPFDVALPNDSVKVMIRIEHSNQEKAVEEYTEIVAELEKQKQKSEVSWSVFRMVHEFIPTKVGNELVYRNMSKLGKRSVSNADTQLANTIYETAGKEPGRFLTDPLPFKAERPDELYGYGSDIGDVSWKAPLISFVVCSLPTGISMSNWEGAAFGKSSFSKDALIDAAQLMVRTSIDYLLDKKVRKAIEEEFEFRTRNRSYSNHIQILPNEQSKKKRSK